MEVKHLDYAQRNTDVKLLRLFVKKYLINNR